MALARTISPLKLSSPLFPVRQPNTRPPKFNYKKTSWDIYQSYIAEHFPSLDFDALNIHQAAHSSSLFLVEAAKGLYPFWPPWSFPPKPGGPRKRNLQFGNDGGPAPWHTDAESHRLRYIDASRRGSLSHF